MLLHESANMEQSVPENLSTHVFNECEMKLQANSHDPADCENGSNSNSDLPTKESVSNSSVTSPNITTTSSSTTTTKVKLSFSVDRLLSSERTEPLASLASTPTRQCCDGGLYACCTFPSCFAQNTEAAKHPSLSAPHAYAYAGLDKLYPALCMDYKSVLRPTPLRAAEHAAFPTLATDALLRFHQQQQQQQQQHHQQQQQQHLHPQQQHQHKAATLLHSSTSAAALLAPLTSLKTLQLAQQQRFLAKTPQQQLLDIPTTATGAGSALHNGGHTHNNHNNNSHNSGNHSNNVNGGGNGSGNNITNNGKRKRSWSRAVFTNLQRKGLEIQFQQQKYITKPDRRKLAARLNLTDAQVKVWFQNRRMKWRHTRENLKSGQEKQPPPQLGTGVKPILLPSGGVAGRPHETLDYSSDSCSSRELSDKGDDDDNFEIDVVE